MPGAASGRGLADPFDPTAAIPASAKGLAEFARRFGNLGLAAAAYNAGPNAFADWLAGKGVLPLETQGYVLAITGHDVEEWRGDKPPASAAPDPKAVSDVCRNLRVALGPDASPWFPRPGRRRLRPRATQFYSAIGHKQLLRLAADANMTARAYVLLALQERGLDGKDDHPHKARTK